MAAITPSFSTPVRKNLAVSQAAAAVAKAEVPDAPNYVSIYASSVFAMAMLFLLGVGIPTAFVYGNSVGWALGVFCAFWGGPSFGVMAGGARVSAWNEKYHPEL